jgi:HD superfamily phosphodiesterase
MKLLSLVKLINHAFAYVINTSKTYNIDESHALKHSMEVYGFTNKIVKNELVNYPILENQKDIIYLSAILHDMCDKKYLSESEGIDLMKDYMKDCISEEKLDVICNIISTMSYSKVKVNGYPNLGEYQIAYHIVREADLLSAYDIDRCIIYSMHKEKLTYEEALARAFKLFENRVFNYRKDDLFVTDYSKNESLILHNNAKNNIELLKQNIFY